MTKSDKANKDLRAFISDIRHIIQNQHSTASSKISRLESKCSSASRALSNAHMNNKMLKASCAVNEEFMHKELSSALNSCSSAVASYSASANSCAKKCSCSCNCPFCHCGSDNHHLALEKEMIARKANKDGTHDTLGVETPLSDVPLSKRPDIPHSDDLGHDF